MADHDEIPMLARGIAGPLGKLTEEAKTKIDPVTQELWLQYCASIRTDTASLLRDFIYMTVHKRSYRQLVLDKSNHEAKCIEALTKLIGSIEAPESGGAHG
ncbi:hypothetical protein [Comamonas odontotermitis]|uniref:hypothetical protein n=1 Tax=Comamonas odontotermitis TaxID=379895 RepID=UPI001CC649CC|nr:hypothetical protein [Comamonas odontotermitis]UBB15452.1 hypothetical protein LAD35_11255 [Comamonas odontotermitis]